MFDGRDVAMMLTGAAALRYWQWQTRRDRPRTPLAEHMARKNLAARFGLWLSRYARLRERVTGRRLAPGVEEDTARRWAERVPRMWL